MHQANNPSGNYAPGLNGSVSSPVISSTGANIKEQNDAVNQWASMVQRHMRQATVLLQHGKDGTISRPGRTERRLEDSIRTRSRLTYGVITGLSFVFERHGVFVHKGVGRGYEMQGGMVVRTAREDSIFSNNQGKVRTPFEWFNPVIEQSLPELADKLAEINADAAVNATRMMIH
jgi:hypothetical protein